VHLLLLFILAHLNFRNIPDLFSFLSGAAEAMNQNEAISEGLDSVKRSVDANALRAKIKLERLNYWQMFIWATRSEGHAAGLAA
jgi:hypothetical protein